MKYLLNGFSSNDNYNGDLDFVLVTLTPRDVEQLLAKMALLKKLYAEDNRVYKLVLWGIDPDTTWFNCAHMGENFLELAGQSDPLVVPDDFEIPKRATEDTASTDGCFTEVRMCGNEAEIAFVVDIKHTSTSVTAWALTEAHLQAAVANLTDRV